MSMNHKILEHNTRERLIVSLVDMNYRLKLHLNLLEGFSGWFHLSPLSWNYPGTLKQYSLLNREMDELKKLIQSYAYTCESAELKLYLNKILPQVPEFKSLLEPVSILKTTGIFLSALIFFPLFFIHCKKAIKKRNQLRQRLDEAYRITRSISRVVRNPDWLSLVGPIERLN